MEEVLYIYSPIVDWKDLQNKVCLLLNQIGLVAECEKKMATPRGEVEVDVYAIDPNSIDAISYVIECKNWNNSINQSIIHSFITIMYETGCNIGYIVSKIGFQLGAINYTKNTNIKLFTFEEFQKHYFKIWMKKYFLHRLDILLERANYYFEPINCARDRAVYILPPDKKEKYKLLRQQYEQFILEVDVLSFKLKNTSFTYNDIHNFLLKCKSLGLEFSSVYLYDIQIQLEKFINGIVSEFGQLFN